VLPNHCLYVTSTDLARTTFISAPKVFSLSPLQGDLIGRWVMPHHRMEVVPSYLGPFKGKSIA